MVFSLEFVAFCLAAVALVAASAFFSGVETGLYTLNKLKLRHQQGRGDRDADRLLRLVRQAETFVAVVLIGNNTVNYLLPLAVLAALRALAGDGEAAGLAGATMAVVTPLLLVFGEMVPKDFFRSHAERVMYRLAPLAWWQFRMLRPAALAVQAAGRTISRLAGRAPGRLDPVLTRGRFERTVQVGREEGILSEHQSRMIMRTLRLSALKSRDIRVPWQKVMTIPDDATRETALAIIGRAPHTRYPLVGGPQRREVTGMLVTQEFLFGAGAPRDHAAPPVVIHPAASAHAALDLLRNRREPVGLLLAGSGGPEGIITVRDILAEIVGELSDI
ncbi:MAG: DUF21 domain-containing protein [Planctomycetes bacterium]|nr:DUF21 domain-containing protein [Planctomycetota bacterium]